MKLNIITSPEKNNYKRHKIDSIQIIYNGTIIGELDNVESVFIQDKLVGLIVKDMDFNGLSINKSPYELGQYEAR